MKVNFYLRDPKAKGKTAIYVQLNYNGKKLRFFPGESIAPEFWNSETGRAEAKSIVKEGEKQKRYKFNEHMEFNERLNRIETSITSIFLDYKNKNNHQIPSPAILKELFEMSMKSGGGKVSFIKYFENFIERTVNGQRLNPHSKAAIMDGGGKNYRSTLNHLKEFSKTWKRKLDFDTIDLEFHADFTNFLIAPPRLNSLNSVGNNIKKVKAVMNEATEKGVNTNMAFKSRYFIKQTEESDNIYLNESELKEMAELDLTDHPRLDRVRDMFLIGAYTALRFSDFSRLQPKNIENGMITIVQSKTNRPVVIPVHPVVKSILEKNGGVPPKEISNQKMNDYLKDLGKKMDSLCKMESKTMTKGGVKVTINKPKWFFLKTHTCRRSFCTNQYKAGIDPILLMAISSHRTQQSFLKYIKVTPQEHAEKLQQIWANSNNLRVA